MSFEKPWTKGGRTRRHLLLAAAIACMGLAALIAGLATRDGRRRPKLPPEPSSPAPPSEEPTAADSLPDVPEEFARIPLTRDAPDPRSPEIPERPAGLLRVAVREGDGAAAAGVALDLSLDPGPHLEGLVVPDERAGHFRATSDERGEARFEGIAHGPYALRAKAADGRRARVEFAFTAARDRVEIALPEGSAEREVVVRVAGTDGIAVAGARVEVYGRTETRSSDWAGPPALAGVTDRQGVARFEDVAYEGGAVFASTSDGRVGKTDVWTREQVERWMRRGGIAVTVAPAGTLSGELRGLPAVRLESARVLAIAMSSHVPYYTTAGRALGSRVSGGRYRFDALPAGTWSLSLEDPGGARLVLPPLSFGGDLPNSVDPIEVEIEPGAMVVRDLEVAAGGRIEGLVRHADGRPVVGAEIFETYAPATSNYPDGFVLRGANVWRFDSKTGTRSDHPATHRRARTDSAGRYVLAGLQPGRHRIEVTAEDLSYDRLEGVAVEDGGTIALEHVLEPAGAIQGVNPQASYLGVTRAGERDPRMIAILPRDGRFAFAGLPAGSWTLAQFHSDASVEPVPIATVEVAAGRTTWIDLSGAKRPIRIAGRIFDASGPVTGARVSVAGTTIETDGGGRFETGVTFPHTFHVRIQVDRAGVGTVFEFPGMGRGDTEWKRDLVVGSESLLVRTLDASGEPTSASFDVHARSLELPAEGGIREVNFSGASTDAFGERAVAGLAPGNYEVMARFADGSEVTSTLIVPADAPVVLRAPATGGLTVEVRESNGSPAPGVWISVTGWPPGMGAETDPSVAPVFWREGESDLEGRATFRGVNAGEILVRAATHTVVLGANPDLARERITLGAGEQRTVVLVLEPR